MMRSPDFVIGPPEAPYLRRWWLIPRNGRFNVYLHNFLHSDDDSALHDHMYYNVSILLRDCYREHFLDGSVALRKPWRPWAFWRLTFRRPATAHRVELIDNAPVWTLFLTGPRVREWGFHCPKGWRHWREFTHARDAGQDGCEDA